MKVITIKAVTIKSDFSKEDYDFFRRIEGVLQAHNLSVGVAISKDRHKRKIENLKLRLL